MKLKKNKKNIKETLLLNFQMTGLSKFHGGWFFLQFLNSERWQEEIAMLKLIELSS